MESIDYKMKVITVCTHPNGYYLSLEESAKRLGYELITLGLGQKWRGFGYRVKLIVEYLKTLDNDEVFMMLDAYDTILIQDSKTALSTFNYYYKGRFVCGAFRKMNGFYGIIQEQIFGNKNISSKMKAPYNSICCGTWMSTVENTIKLWNFEIEDNDDDQRILNKMFEEQRNDLIVPDCNFNIFATFCPNSILFRKIPNEDRVSIIDKRIYCGVTNTYPIAIHALANIPIDNLLKTLDFTNTKDITQNNYAISKILYNTKLMCKYSIIIQSVCAIGSGLLILSICSSIYFL